MRLSALFLLVALCLALTFDGVNSQLTFGTNGLRMPPINLATVYKILVKTWNMIMNPKKKKIAKAQGKGNVGAENRLGVADDEENEIHENIVDENLVEDNLSDHEKMFLDEFKIKTKLICHDEKTDCSNLMLSDFIERDNITFTEEEKNIVLKVVDAISLDTISVSEFANAPTETEKLEQKYLQSEPKTPSFLPFPFASGGWIASYIVLNSVLLGLYVFLAGPYLISGRTVERFVSDDAIDGIDPVLNAMTEHMGNQYMGYTTYGDTDMMMGYMLGADNEEEEEEEEEQNSTYNEQQQEEEEETNCIENMLCLRPVYGARALSSTSLVLKLLEWIPGFDTLGSKFKKNFNRMGEAVAQGRQSNCHNYQCKRRR